MIKHDLVFGIDIGGTNTKIGLFDHFGELLHDLTVPTIKDSDPREFITSIADECEKILKSKFNISLGDKRIMGVGVGAPMANYFTGEIEYAPNIGWRKAPLRSLFEEIFKTQATLENDANLAAIGEKKWGSGKDLQDFILITLGTGVGTALVLDGKLYRGHKALGGEGGHIIIPSEENRQCSCGGMNHIESFLSAKGIKETITEITGEDWTIEELGEEFQKGHEGAAKVIDQMAISLAYGLTNMATLVAPQAFIMGGGVSRLGPDFFKVALEKFNVLCHFSLRGKVKIIPASLSAHQGAIYGGAAQIINEVLRK